MDTEDLPHPAGRIPWLGDVRGISRHRTMIQDTMRMGAGLGPIFTRALAGREIVIVAGGALTAELSDETRFAKSLGVGIEVLREVAGDGLFTAYDHEPNWHAAHAVLHSSFSAASMRLYHPVMLAAAQDLVASWTARAGQPVDVPADMTRMTLETIGRAGFGYSFGSFSRREPHPFVEAMARVLVDAGTTALLPDWLPRPGAARHAADVALMNQLVDGVIARRRASGDTRTDDLLGRMLHSPAPQTGEPLDDVNIRHQVITFLIAGHETSAGAMAFALHHLLASPAAMERARAEVDEQWGDVDAPDYGQVAKLRHVRRVFDESLRLWPTAPLWNRQARRDTVLGGRWAMRAGDTVRILLPMVHRDPSVWGEDAERFDPDRFLPEQVHARPAHTYKPFGTGDRACIGRQFALHESVLALGLILRHFDLSPPPGEPYRLRVRELLSFRPDGLQLIARPRTVIRAGRPAGTR